MWVPEASAVVPPVSGPATHVSVQMSVMPPLSDGVDPEAEHRPSHRRRIGVGERIGERCSETGDEARRAGSGHDNAPHITGTSCPDSSTNGT